MTEEKPQHIEVASIYGIKTRQGLVEIAIDATKVQLPLDKARKVAADLLGAIEAAVSDELLVLFLTTKVGISIEAAAAMLVEFRELRQGTRGAVYPH